MTCAGVVLAGVASADAAFLLGTANNTGFFQRANANSTPYTSGMFALGVDDTNPANALFSDIAHNAPGIFFADVGTYPTLFPTIASKLSDGLVNNLHMFNGFNTPTFLLTGFSGGPEALQLTGDTGVDFDGYTITHIRQVINSISIAPTSSTATGITYDITYQFWGEVVPAPSSAAMLLGGCIAVRRRRR
jgi:hypothetical protein